eukprot:3541278-Amphidinium_carterae.3
MQILPERRITDAIDASSNGCSQGEMSVDKGGHPRVQDIFECRINASDVQTRIWFKLASDHANEI